MTLKEENERLRDMVYSLYHWILEIDRSGDAYDYCIADYIHYPKEADDASVKLALEIWPDDREDPDDLD